MLWSCDIEVIACYDSSSKTLVASGTIISSESEGGISGVAGLYIQKK